VILTFIYRLSVINSMIRFSFVEPTYLLAVGLVLLVIAMVIGSDLGLRAPMLLVGLVWVLHLSLGLAVIRLAIVNLARWRATARWPDLGLLLLAGLIASLVLAPVSLAIDQWLMSFCSDGRSKAGGFCLDYARNGSKLLGQHYSYQPCSVFPPGGPR
jgi:hypothetical protein